MCQIGVTLVWRAYTYYLRRQFATTVSSPQDNGLSMDSYLKWQKGKKGSVLLYSFFSEKSTTNSSSNEILLCDNVEIINSKEKKKQIHIFTSTQQTTVHMKYN